MYIVNFVLRSGASLAPSAALRFREAVLRHVRELDGFEHVWVKQQLESLDVLFFMLADNPERAEVDAVTLCECALADPDFSGLGIVSCVTRSPAHEEEAR